MKLSNIRDVVVIPGSGALSMTGYTATVDVSSFLRPKKSRKVFKRAYECWRFTDTGDFVPGDKIVGLFAAWRFENNSREISQTVVDNADFAWKNKMKK